MYSEKELIRRAMAAAQNAYAPYSGFRVGAALLAKDGTVYTGCNIENAAFSPTCCAERVAVFKAVSEGKHDFSAIAVVGTPADGSPRDYTAPCGVCRQVLQEFCNPQDFQIIMAKSEDDYKTLRLAELLPHGFGGGFFTKEA